MQRHVNLLFFFGFALSAGGCAHNQSVYDLDLGHKAEKLGDYDAALQYYRQALSAHPDNASYKIKVNQLRFDAAQRHIQQGYTLRDEGDLQGAEQQFQRAFGIDPSSSAALQQLKATAQTIATENSHGTDTENLGRPPGKVLASAPPEMKPMSLAPIDLKMSNDAKTVFDTIGKLAGLTMIYDADFPAHRITVEMNNVTIEQALDIVALESKAFWEPVTQNVVFVTSDQPQKRRDYEEQVMRTFYLSNTVQSQDITEIVTGLRQLLDLKRVQQINAQNSIVIRDTPAKLALAAKFIEDSDKARPEVVIQVEVLQASTDRLRTLGVLPGQSASLTFTGPSSSSSTSSSSTSGTAYLDALKDLTQDFSVTLPGATASAVMTDSRTTIIQDPELRSVDGQLAKLRVGDRVPVATGSYGTGATVSTTSVSALVNTQFQYIDVGVSLDVTPRIHANHEISMKVAVEVSTVSSYVTIGSIQQPVISQRKIEHDIRLKEGEVNVLGGLFQRTDTKSVNGWPGLSKIPFLRYLTSTDNKEVTQSDVLIVLIPRIVRVPEWTKDSLRAVYSGTETNVAVRAETDITAPPTQNAVPKPAASLGVSGGQPVSGAPAPPTNENVTGTSRANSPAPSPPKPIGRLRFDPQAVALKPGQTASVALLVEDATDLFSVPLLLSFDPAVVSIEDVHDGGFLSGGTQEVAVVEHIDKEHGQALISATRQPGTPGATGKGALVILDLKGVALGTSQLSIAQISAKDSQRRSVALATSGATVRVQP